MIMNDILFENGTRIKLARKLMDECIYHDRIRNTKLKNCAGVVSSTMQSLLMLMVPYATIPDGNNQVSSNEEAVRDTAEMIGFFDKLFDSLNGSKRYAKGSGSVKSEMECYHWIRRT